MRNVLSRDERAVGDTISTGVIVSVLNRRDDGVPGRFVCEELVRCAAELVRTCRGGGRRVEGSGAYEVGVVVVFDDDCRECESNSGISPVVVTVGASLSREVLYEFAIGGVYGRGVCRIGCTNCVPKRLLEAVVVEISEVALVVRL